MHGYPNFFFVMGPNTILAHNSVILIIEAQVDYIMQVIATMLQRNIVEVEVELDKQQAFNNELKKSIVNTVWSEGGCKSWYLNNSTKNTVLWPGFAQSFLSRTRKVDPASFQWSTRKQDGHSLHIVRDCSISRIQYIDDQYQTNYTNFFVAFLCMLIAQAIVGYIMFVAF